MPEPCRLCSAPVIRASRSVSLDAAPTPCGDFVIRDGALVRLGARLFDGTQAVEGESRYIEHTCPKKRKQK